MKVNLVTYLDIMKNYQSIEQYNEKKFTEPFTLPVYLKAELLGVAHLSLYK